ncbi:MAG: dTDP-4-dehydrorhamnose 3,5-epimerase [Magnetococcales bacterium]|nr:dTDP-4-dehydrorhamnose 3,5-epimerase [Magnetococcales bacterium]MBF0110695.1 dTDP-4-dehydrorhamnose 3,5-epimerase [Magnetococcales bacterium]MBF0116748.1 dTDP-4-dehydrorhamnose 3,5-epimerase [Magnetococcales bacterium]
MIEGVTATPLKIIATPGGDVYHGIRNDDPGYVGFGEAYFSSVLEGTVKPWKRHRRMTLNLIVIHGLIRFVVHDDRRQSATCGVTTEYRMGPSDFYGRLTVSPGLWMAFQGLASGASFLLNVASIPHDPTEADRHACDAFPFDWSSK